MSKRFANVKNSGLFDPITNEKIIIANINTVSLRSNNFLMSIISLTPYTTRSR